MLYWHLGLKRTGTTSLQTALVVHQVQLAEAGIVYPEMWRARGLAGYSTHHGLTEVIESSSENALPVRQFKRYLSEQAGRSVLLSSEFVSEWIAEERREAVLRTISRAQSVMPVTCIWTLRRLDETINSLRLRRVLLGADFAFPTQEDISRIAGTFAAALAGMRSIAEVVHGRVVYVKYAADGAHNGSIMRAVGLPDRIRGSIERGLSSGPRLNPQLTYKGAVALRYRDVISGRSEAAIDELDLRRALFLGEFKFSGDSPCEMLGHEARRALHEGALAAADGHGIGDYVRFFEADAIDARAPVELDPDALTDEDLARLGSYVRGLKLEHVDLAIRRGYMARDPERDTARR